MAVSDDDIIKRKLLIEGEGGNDDIRLTRLIKTFNKWCNSTSDSPAERQEGCEKVLMTADHVEAAMTKATDVYEMNLREQELYKNLSQEIESCIVKAQKEILDSKAQLLQAKRHRRNKQEYDALAKVIQQHPDRQETLRQLKKLSQEIENMKCTKLELQEQLEIRKKQFHVLITAIHELQWMLEEYDIGNSKRDETENGSSMDTT